MMWGWRSGSLRRCRAFLAPSMRHVFSLAYGLNFRSARSSQSPPLSPQSCRAGPEGVEATCSEMGSTANCLCGGASWGADRPSSVERASVAACVPIVGC
eukprot:3622570-Pyramimonas_sp.AAC.1